MHRTFDKQRYQDLVDKLASAVSDSYTEPTDALKKLAREERMGAPMVKLVAHAFNMGSVAHQSEAGQSINEKLASIPLADPDAVIASLYDADNQFEKQKAATKDYDQSPMELLRAQGLFEEPKQKVAFTELDEDTGKVEDDVDGVSAVVIEVEPPEIDDREASTAFDTFKEKSMQLREINAKKREAEYELRDALHKLRDYFTNMSSEIEGLDTVFDHCKTLIGGDVEPIFGHMRKMLDDFHSIDLPGLSFGKSFQGIMGPGPKCKRAASIDMLKREPYSLVKRAYDTQEKINDLNMQWLRIKEAEEQKEFEQYKKEAKAQKDPVELFRHELGWFTEEENQVREKVAIIPAWLSLRTAWDAVKGPPKEAESNQTAEDSKWKDELELATDLLTSPEHIREMKGMHVRSMLNDLISNDPTISQYEPQKVYDMYNNIAEMAPLAAQRRALVGEFLRNSLPGDQIDQFAISDLSGIEKNLRQGDLGQSFNL